MIVIILRQSMLSDLFEDDDERINQVFEIARSLLNLIEVVVETGGHHRWVPIAKCTLHVHVKLVNGCHFVEANQDHDGLFADHFLLVLHESEHDILHGYDDAWMGQERDGV